METYIVNPGIEEYMNKLAPVEDETLREMERLGQEREFPIVGPLVGRFLYQLATMINAGNIFEMGSGFGYSAYWFAKAVGEEGTVIFTDFSQRNADLASGFFQRGGLDKRVKILVGDSIEILESTDREYDIIFNDIDKEHYPLVVDKVYRKLRRGGLFITDNLLWRGKVITGDTSSSTKSVMEFTRILLSERGFITTIIPIRDGISLSVKL